MNLVFTLGLVVALAAAARSTWSPCGLSMLSTITPITEQARGRRYAATVPWYLLGSIAGGATLGLLAATLSIPIRALDLPTSTVLAVVGVLAVVSILSDLRVGGFQLPRHGRQVDRLWLDHYRSWVYGTGFGWQIGVGLATYIVTSAVYLVVAIAALTGSARAGDVDRRHLRDRPRFGDLPRPGGDDPRSTSWLASQDPPVRAGVAGSDVRRPGSGGRSCHRSGLGMGQRNRDRRTLGRPGPAQLPKGRNSADRSRTKPRRGLSLGAMSPLVPTPVSPSRLAAVCSAS